MARTWAGSGTSRREITVSSLSVVGALERRSARFTATEAGTPDGSVDVSCRSSCRVAAPLSDADLGGGAEFETGDYLLA